jgi:hypothetical protein
MMQSTQSIESFALTIQSQPCQILQQFLTLELEAQELEAILSLRVGCHLAEQLVEAEVVAVQVQVVEVHQVQYHQFQSHQLREAQAQDQEQQLLVQQLLELQYLASPESQTQRNSSATSLALLRQAQEPWAVEATYAPTTAEESLLSFKPQASSMKKDLAERSSMLSIKPLTEARAAEAV